MIALKNKFSKIFSVVITCLFFLSCQKDLDYVTSGYDLPDLTTKVTSSVSGFVTDENNVVVLGANVSVGGTSTTTDKYGYFEVKNVQVVKNTAMVTVNHSGYFKGIKTYIATANKAAFFRIKLIPKTNVGSINGGLGGNVTLSNGLIIALPANGVITAGSGAAYTGTVSVSAHWLNPVASDIHQTMPGDLRGIATDGSLKTLTTYGMAAVELTGASGELLQIATGKKATLTLTIPSSILAAAPASIPLWSFDETNGLWKQEGTAIKTGNTYVGEVSHFSFWNYDVPANYVQFDCTVKDPAGNPIPYVWMTITVVGTNNIRGGHTNVSGYASGAVPDNSQLLLQIFSVCGDLLYSQNFNTSNINVSLGVISITNISYLHSISGTVTDCNNNPVTNGFITMNANSYFYKYPLDNTGAYSFVYVTCNNPTIVTFIGEDNTTNQQSIPLQTSIAPGANVVGNLQACGMSTQQYISYTVNGGTPVSLAPPTHYFGHSLNGNIADIGAYGNNGTGSGLSLKFDNQGIAVGSTQNMIKFYASSITDSTNILAPIGINITEYGTVGQYISGNFSGIVTGWQPPNNTYNVVCNFRVKRNY